MAEIFGNLRVRGGLIVDGTGGGLNRVEYTDNSLDGDFTVTDVATENQFLPFTSLAFGTGENAPDNLNTYLVKGTFPFFKITADGIVTIRFYMGTPNGAIVDPGVVLIQQINIAKDSTRPDAVASFSFVCQPPPDYRLGTSVETSTNGVTMSGGGVAATLFGTLAIERIT